MAATISVNFATEQEVYQTEPSDKKSVSAKLLSDVLGGGVVSGGYVRKTGDGMTGFLTLTSISPLEDYHAAPKRYVDDHAYTRRYLFECKNTNGYGFVPTGGVVLSGADLNTNLLYFFDPTDTVSLNSIGSYIDIYRNGILQVYGSNKDYTILSNNNVVGSVSAIKFEEPFQNGETFQVSIGSQGAFPVTFGVYRLFDGFAIRTSALSGDVTVNVVTSAFASSLNQVRNRNSNDTYISPTTLSAYPLVPKAVGVFEKTLNYDRIAVDRLTNPDPPYGSLQGNFDLKEGTNILTAISRPALTDPSYKIRVTLPPNIVTNTNYNVVVTIPSDSGIPEESLFASTIISSKTLTSFDFVFYTLLLLEPEDLQEFSVFIY